MSAAGSASGSAASPSQRSVASFSDPSREKMLLRLAGMDLKRVFDLDGSGFIDPIVLARSLKIWDANVFTDDAITDFYKWSGLAKVGGDSSSGSIIAIQDLARFVSKYAPKMPRMKRRSSSRGGEGSTVSSVSGVGTGVSEAASFTAAPRSCRTRDPSASEASSARRKEARSDRSKSTTRKTRGEEDGTPGGASKAASEVVSPTGPIDDMSEVKSLASQFENAMTKEAWAAGAASPSKGGASSSTEAAHGQMVGIPAGAAADVAETEAGLNASAAEPELVMFRVVVPNIDFHAMSEEVGLQREFEDCAKETICAEVEHPPENVLLTLSSGSVIIDATIVPLPGTDMDALRMKAGSDSLSKRIVSNVSALKGIAALSSGAKGSEGKAASSTMGGAEASSAPRPATGGRSGQDAQEPENEPDSEPTLPDEASWQREAGESKSAAPQEPPGKPQSPLSSIQKKARGTVLDTDNITLQKTLQEKLSPHAKKDSFAQLEVNAPPPEAPAEGDEDAIARIFGGPQRPQADKKRAPPPPSAELVNRLANLNILKVLDVDGSGLIDRDVLKCSLQIFDPKVFTDEACDSLIHAAIRGRGMDDGKEIRILDLALFMGAPVLYPVTPIAEVGDDGEEEDDEEAGAMESVPPSPYSQGQSRLGTAESMLAFAMGQTVEEDEWSRGTGGLHTARTEIESVVGDLQSARVALAELKAGALGCTIKRPEMRGITLKQLKRVMNYVEEHCERESWYDPETEELLSPELVDMHCLTEWVLKPATKDRRCSFVEMIAPRPSAQRPTWYVSHCSGPVKDFVLCLMEHSKRHHFTDDCCYWVDAFANNPWGADKEDEGLWEKALHKTEGSVQVIGHGPVAYLEVGAHGSEDVDAEPFSGVRYLSPKAGAATAAKRDEYC